MACVNSCESCEIIAVGAVVTVRERQGTGSGGVGVVRAVNHDGTLCVKYTLGGTARAVASADCRPGNHAGEHYENKLTKWRKRVDGFFGCDEKEEDGAYAARVAVLRLDDLIDKKSPEQVESQCRNVHGTFKLEWDRQDIINRLALNLKEEPRLVTGITSGGVRTRQDAPRAAATGPGRFPPGCDSASGRRLLRQAN
mmetsp:Transcript_12022/g.31620  ORF Transcript_12022/g.31620 Transcript_12022/m.31620 type:complete len:197 (+) Transcript_12022:178-768(+)